MLQCYLNASNEKHPKHAAEIENELYVHDLVTGGSSVQVREKKGVSVEISRHGSFIRSSQELDEVAINNNSFS